MNYTLANLRAMLTSKLHRHSQESFISKIKNLDLTKQQRYPHLEDTAADFYIIRTFSLPTGTYHVP